jgi:hypothetical protein
MVIGCDDVNLSKTTPLTFFVGMNRARESLHLITSLKAGVANTIHPYVLSLPNDNCEYLVHRKTGRVADRLSNSSALVRRVRS